MLTLNACFIFIKGNFATRGLPSNGLFPFLRGVLCELNNTCYTLPRDVDAPPSPNQTNSTSQFDNLKKLFVDIIQFANQPEVVNNTMKIASFSRDILNQRNKASKITGNLTLSQYLYTNVNNFTYNANLIVKNQALVDSLLK